MLTRLFIISAALALGTTTHAVVPLPAPTQTFFKAHCTSCHGAKKQKGDLRVDTLKMDFASPKTMAHWEEIMNRINSRDMPPEGEDRPKPEEIATVAQWIAAQLLEGEAVIQTREGERVTHRKLSREEYANSIRDLLGVTVMVADPSGLPEDPDWHGFERIGSVLTLSPAHIEKYYAVADAALRQALALGPESKRELVRWGPYELRGNWKSFQKEYEERGISDKLRVDIVPNNGQLDQLVLEVKTAGEYRVRMKLSGLRAVGGRAPRLKLYMDDIDRVLFEQDIEAPEDQPVTIEFRTQLPLGEHFVKIINAVPGTNPEGRRSRSTGTPNGFTSLAARVPWQMKLTDDAGRPLVPFLLLDFIEWDGPIHDGWPTKAHERIFFGGAQAVKDAAYAREIVARFAERAWRRPVQPAEVVWLAGLVQQTQTLGETFEGAVKTALLAVLCSKNFIYLEEGRSTAAKKPGTQISNHELASRLSYFLWSTMPDERLLDLARQNKLHERATLRAEVRRMLADARVAEFADSFPRQWLQLRKVGMFAPDRSLYPDYDDALEQSMIAETLNFFSTVLKANGSVSSFLDSDWTMLNEHLARHYGIAGVMGEAMQRVALQPEHHRGGLLTHAAILSLTSDGTRHRPVHRGVWVLESLLGRPPPPPPANVPALDTPKAGAPKTTVRAKLEQHRADPSCTACHNKIDPLGIAFDNYDAIGRWRTVETVKDGTGANPTLDPSGVLPDGRQFADGSELKQLLLTDLEKFAAAFTEKLATYALRRGMTFTDRKELKRIADQAKASDYALASLIESLVTSPLFLKR